MSNLWSFKIAGSRFAVRIVCNEEGARAPSSDHSRNYLFVDLSDIARFIDRRSLYESS